MSQLFGISKVNYYTLKIDKKIFYIGCKTGIDNLISLKIYELDF